MRHLLILTMVVVLSACATSRGFDRGQLRSHISEEKTVTEEEIRQALELRPQLSAPFRLAVHFQQPDSYGSDWLWQGPDKDAFMELGSELKRQGVISEIVPLNQSMLGGEDRKAIRLAAARAGADAVLIVNGATAIDRYNNALGATYALLITPVFVPGTVADGLFMANASLWDVRNDFLYMSVESEGTASETRPAFFIEESRVLRKAQTAAVTELVGALSSRMKSMSVESANSDPAHGPATRASRNAVPDSG